MTTDMVNYVLNMQYKTSYYQYLAKFLFFCPLKGIINRPFPAILKLTTFTRVLSLIGGQHIVDQYNSNGQNIQLVYNLFIICTIF